MGVYTARVAWNRGDADFLDNRYSRAHTWEFDGGAVVPASASPQIVPVPMSDASAVDPEEAFVAALSSCHMLFFLSIAAKKRLVVESYVDRAEGEMSKDDAGRMVMKRVTLRPEITFGGDRTPYPGTVERIHHLAHEACFLANSVKCEVVVAV